jgi:hypothetical protein
LNKNKIGGIANYVVEGIPTLDYKKINKVIDDLKDGI